MWKHVPVKLSDVSIVLSQHVRNSTSQVTCHTVMSTVNTNVHLLNNFMHCNMSVVPPILSFIASMLSTVRERLACSSFSTRVLLARNALHDSNTLFSYRLQNQVQICAPRIFSPTKHLTVVGCPTD